MIAIILLISVQAFSQNLISAEHAWILPSYYERNWWRENSLNDDDGCSDSMMQEILESVIFVNNVKIPPMVNVVNGSIIIIGGGIHGALRLKFPLSPPPPPPS